MAEDPGRRAGLVVALQANYVRVRLDQAGPAGVERLLCTRRARLDRAGQGVCVGDRVEVEGIDWTLGRGAVVSRDRRRNALDRPAVANIDRVIVVMALAEPAPDPLQLTRFLLSAEATGQTVHPVLSKADLVSEQEVSAWIQRLACWGYDALTLRRGPQGLDSPSLERLRNRLAVPGIAVICGPSGVGKSSLLNALLPDRALRVGEVSGRLRRGRHTTRHVELFALDTGQTAGQQALLADTPGFNRPDLSLPAEALAPLFPEIRARLALERCRYSNCAHLEDPGCAVGHDWDRFAHYRQILEELRQQDGRQDSRTGGTGRREERRGGRRRGAELDL